MRAMSKLTSVLGLSLSLLMPPLALSHSDHDGHSGAPSNDVQAMEAATEYVRSAVEKSELVAGVALDASWQAGTEAKIHERHVRYFIVSLYNASQEKTLYVLLGPDGQVHDANFDGAFGRS